MPLKDKRVFITGGAGFIGTTLARRLVDENDLVVLDNLHRDALSGTELEGHANLAFHQGDVTVDNTTIKALRSVGLAQVYFLDTKKAGFKRYVAEPGKFMDRDGSMWLREGTGTTARHAYSATYFRRVQNFCQNPGLNARWDGVTGQTLVVVRDL